ncbi:MAG: TolC family outer membrane protein [Proteobacteria bacterium]|nr:TolC family outer membrane protein [Pseudomonadota bacterium]MBU4469863.1 TolC family outer membrane protein [Pseudomonadota bacterium]MCG2753098.1 TolC family outer membrane protein [Desulfobacteraceae bacterium]
MKLNCLEPIRLCALSLLVALGIAIFLPVMAGAEGLMDIFVQAREKDPLLKGAYYKQLSIQEGRKQAMAKLLPNLSSFGEYTKTFQDIKSSDNTVFGMGSTDFGSTHYGLTLTQPVFRWDTIVGFQQSKMQSLQAEAEYHVALQDLIIRVSNLYLDALIAQGQLHFSEIEQTAVEKHFELASSRHKMGLIPITDLHDVKARLANIKAKAIEARNQLDDTLQALQEITDREITKLKGLKTKIPHVSPEPAKLDHWVDASIKQNLTLALYHHAVDVARKEVDRQKALRYPTLDLVGNYSNDNTDGSLFGGGSDVTNSDIGLKLNLPIYQGGEISSRVRQASHQLSYADQELTRQQRAVVRQVRSSFLGVKSALSRIDALEQSVISNKLALEAKQEGFLSGLYTSLAVLDAERDLSFISIDYVRARYDYILNSLKLRQAAGTLNDADLMAIDQWFSK